MVLMNLLAGSNGDANIENTLVDLRGGRPRRESDEWRLVGNICATICKIDSRGNLLYDSGSLNQDSVTT